MRPINTSSAGLNISTDSFCTDDDGDDREAPDLEVEASPPHYDDSPAVGKVARDDANISYFSEYGEGQVAQEDQEVFSPPPRLGVGIKEKKDVCDRKLFSDFLSHGDGVQAIADADQEEDADEFCDAEERSTTARFPEESFVEPVRRLDAAVDATKVVGSTAPVKKTGGCTNNLMDPVRASSTRSSRDAAVADLEKVPLLKDTFFRNQRLSESPVCASESGRERRRDAHTLNWGSSDQWLTGAGGPSPPPRCEGGAFAPRTANKGSYGRRPMRNVISSHASTSHSTGALQVLPLCPILTGSPDEGTGRGAGVSAGSPTAFPCVTAPSCDAQISLSPENNNSGRTAASSPPLGSRATVATTPMGQLTPGDATLNRLMVSAVEGGKRAAPGMHVVRGRLPHCAPLILQCTGHLQTPTQTNVVIDSAMGSEVGKTLTAGLHTSVYKETGDRSVLSFSSSVSGDGTMSLGCKLGGDSGGPVLLRSSLQPHPEMVDNAPYRVPRSTSPLVSLADTQFVANDSVSVGCPNQRKPHNGFDASPLPSPSHGGEEEEIGAVPDLIEFSIQTETLEPSEQDAPLIFCGYSVEPICAGCDANTSSEVFDGHRVPSPYFFTTFTPTSANAPPATCSTENRVPFLASQNREKLQADGQGTEKTWARPRVEVARSPYFPPPPWAPDGPCGEDRTRGDSDSAISFVKSPHFGYPVGHIPLTPPSSVPAAQLDGYGSLAVRQEREKALHALLAQQTKTSDKGRSPTMSHVCADGQGSVRPVQSIAPAADYVAKQEQLRKQRLAEETERARLGLVLAVCEAVRPHARDLLFVFLLLMEEPSMRDDGTLGGSLTSYRDPSRLQSTACCPPLDAAASGESRVTYETCAEAVNCVLERHGVSWVRATRELCRRVVAWCRYYYNNGYTQHGEPALLLDSLRGTADEVSVEYATFISAVMDFAALYSA